MKLIGLTAAVVLFAASSVLAEDWPHWAGPNYNCTSNEKGLLKEWPKEGPKVLWKIPAGVGSNHPAVAGDDVCFAESGGDFQTESVRCVDLATGKEKWKYTYDTHYPANYWGGVANTNLVGWGKLGVRATPVITDKYVYSIGTMGDGVCIDRKTGKMVWKRDFKEKNPAFVNAKGEFCVPNEWKGYNCSFLVVGDKILDILFGGGFLTAIDAKTGKTAWDYDEAYAKGARPFCTMQPYPMKYHDEDCCLIFNNYEWKMIRVSDGKQVWKWEAVTGKSNYCNGFIIPASGNYYWCVGVDGVSPGIVECDFKAADPKPKRLWSGAEANDNVVPPTFCDGYIYGFGYENRADSWEIGAKPNQILSLRCTDMKTGQTVWKSKPQFQYGISITSADGMLFVHSYQTLWLIKADPKGYVEKGKVEKLHNVNYARGNEQALVDWNMPVIAYGKLLVRTPDAIICYDIHDPQSKTTTQPATSPAASPEGTGIGK